MPDALSIVLCALARRSVVVVREDTPSNDKFTLYDCMSHNLKLEYKFGSSGNSNWQVPGSNAHKFAVFLCSRKKYAVNDCAFFSLVSGDPYHFQLKEPERERE